MFVYLVLICFLIVKQLSSSCVLFLATLWYEWWRYKSLYYSGRIVL